MTEPDHDRVSEIFLDACELEPGEQEAFLERECAGNKELRAEVESLLAHDQAAPRILREGALPRSAEQAAETPPDSIGPYRVAEQVGSGGMGVVYRALQEQPIQRTVAIKLIRLGIETRQVIARFDSERQALALMQHANIARVLDAGTTSEGRPYFVMEYVEGEPLHEYCDRRRLTIRERLELFCQVCEGVQHAHQRAIIHRDVKPSNVLVATEDGEPVPKIIDFGVAKAIDRDLAERTASTEMGQLVGTPEYMSPEQAALSGHPVDTRTDVYSLGVLLYELLVGAHPFAGDGPVASSIDELRRKIREDDPPRPSIQPARLPDAAALASTRGVDPGALARRLRGDLDWITMKAMRKEPEQRYASPAELAADISRHLNHDPVLASPPSRRYRLGKFIRKHRVGVGFAAAVAVLVLGSAAALGVQAVRIASERDRANREAVRAVQEAATSEQVLEFLVGLFAHSDPNQARGRNPTALEILDGSVEKIDRELAGQPQVQARLLAAVGRVYRNLGSHERSRELFERARDRLEQVLGPEHPESLRTSKDLAFTLFYEGRLEQAESLYVETLAVQRRVRGFDHPETLNTMRNLANLYTVQRRYDEAEVLGLETLETARRVLGEEHPLTLRSKNDLSVLYRIVGRYDDAEPLAVDALRTQRRVLGEDHPSTLGTMNDLAILHMDRRRFDEAEVLLLETLTIKRRVLGQEHPSTLKSIYNLACLEALSQRSDEALVLLREAVDHGYVRKGMAQDPDLASLEGLPEFDALVAVVEERLRRETAASSASPK